MLHLFGRDPERVSWQLTPDSGFCSLIVHHSEGMIVERFASREQALRRVQELADYLDLARRKTKSTTEGPDGR